MSFNAESSPQVFLDAWQIETGQKCRGSAGNREESESRSLHDLPPPIGTSPLSVCLFENLTPG